MFNLWPGGHRRLGKDNRQEVTTFPPWEVLKWEGVGSVSPSIGRRPECEHQFGAAFHL